MKKKKTKEQDREKVSSNQQFLVAMRLGETPVPIPNTMVKTSAADGTALETVWESRWMPDPLKTGFTSDQRIEQKFSFLMTDKASVRRHVP